MSANELTNINLSDETKITCNKPLDLSANKISNVASPVENSDVATKSYVDNNAIQVGNVEQIYFNRSLNSDIGSYYQLGTNLTGTGQVSNTYTLIYGAGTNQLLATFATNLGYPNVTVIPQGVMTFHIWAIVDSRWCNGSEL